MVRFDIVPQYVYFREMSSKVIQSQYVFSIDPPIILVPPEPPSCASSLIQPEYKRNKVIAPHSQLLASNIATIHRLEDILAKQIKDTASDSQLAGEKFDDFVANGVEQSTEEQLEAFAASKRQYVSEVASTKMVQFKLTKISETVKNSLREEADETPPFPVVTPPFPVVSTTSSSDDAGMKKAAPVWSDFANSQDTKWSKKHAKCPQGPPCFCDCRCRGAPPQNFIASDPPVLKPCPPPPPPPSTTGFTPIN